VTLVAGAAGLRSACQAEIDGIVGNEKPGMDPPVDRLYFPTGLALTPDGRYLLVTNGNTDLKYNGGALSVVDVPGALDRLGRPDDFPEACRRAPYNPLAVECQEGAVTAADGSTLPGLIRADLTMRLGLYPGFLAVEDLATSAFAPWMPADAGGTRRYRVYVAVRGEPDVTFMDLVTDATADGAEVTCADCGGGCDGRAPHDCTDAYTIEEPSAGREDLVSYLPNEPYGLAVEPAGGFLLLAHMVNGTLSLVDLVGYQGDLRRGGPDLVEVRANVMSTDQNGLSGGYDVVARTPGDPNGWFYVSNHAAAQILTVRVAGADGPVAEDRGLRLVLGPSINLTAPAGPLESGVDLRGLTMSPDGSHLLALARTPPVLVSIDTTEADGAPRNAIETVVEVCPKPSLVRARVDALGRTLAYVVCFTASVIYVVDVADAQVIDRIETGSGPHGLTLLPDQPAYPGGPSGFGFVANFADHSVGVIDLREDSPTYHVMVGLIGWPEELKQ
jgi:DNA-binding beta-propeller fold protein YncE